MNEKCDYASDKEMKKRDGKERRKREMQKRDAKERNCAREGTNFLVYGLSVSGKYIKIIYKDIR